MAQKPLLFVGSSAENLKFAYAVQENLDPHDARVKVWPQGVFKISDYTLDSLLETLKTSDFGIFIFAPDDVLTARHKKQRVVRDNVLFELGLFMGRLGRERTFIFVPMDAKLGLPSDLYGLNIVTYDSLRDDPVAALGVACNKVRTAIAAQGFFKPDTPTKDVSSLALPIEEPPPFRSISTKNMKQKRILTSAVSKQNKPLGKKSVRRPKALKPLKSSQGRSLKAPNHDTILKPLKSKVNKPIDTL